MQMNNLFPFYVLLSFAPGIQPATVIPDEMQEQENILHECARQLEGAELTRVTLVSLLQEAIQDQVHHHHITSYLLFYFSAFLVN